MASRWVSLRKARYFIISLLNKVNDEIFSEIVKEALSFSDILIMLGYNSISSAVANKVKERVKKLKLDTSHFKKTHSKKPRSFEEIFCENSTVNLSVLRKHYKKELYTEYKCAICGLESEWEHKPLTLILDHINGKNHDNRLSNLRWVCPNCNAQLETTGAKNYKKPPIPPKYCIDCGKQITYKSIRCLSCAMKKINAELERETKDKISREELKKLIRTTPFTQIGKKFGVSDNAVRKWCDYYNLPRKAYQIQKITDKEWENI